MRDQRSPVQSPCCNEVRPRRLGYQLRCLEPAGHAGDHRWTPELVHRTGPGPQRSAQRAHPPDVGRPPRRSG